MQKIILPTLLLCLLSLTAAQAQSAKIRPPKTGPVSDPPHHGLRPIDRPAVPPAANPFGTGPLDFKTMPALSPIDAEVRVTRGENGLPIFFQGQTAASGSADDKRAAEERALEYLASLPLEGVDKPAAEFVAKTASTDEQGNQHVRFQQVFEGVPVYGGEMIAHTRNGAFVSLNGRYYPTLRINTAPALTSEGALQIVVAQIGADKVKTDWTAQELQAMGGQAFNSELVVYHEDRRLDAARLAWVIEGYPNFLNRVVYVIDAQTGAVIHHYDHTCRLLPEHLTPESGPETAPPPPVTASGLDLLNINRSFGAWQSGGTVYMEDASKPMFNSTQSQMPSDPVGAIVTLNALNTSPQNANFDYTIVTSNSTTFNNPTAVSAHYNAGKSYDYYKNTFNRNSINGSGGNIISFVNVTEPNGTSMENAS